MRSVNQDTLRELEALCTQEQPPAAMAVCPLHVECREICAAVSFGDFDTAYDLYCRRVPFPGILSRLCSGPCEKSCIRKDLGGSVSMRKLEESVCLYGKAKKRRTFLPRRNDRVAVIGGGLYGLTLALELAKKGCKITLFEKKDRLGGRLLDEKKLPSEILEKDLMALKDYPITVELNREIKNQEELGADYEEVLTAYGFKFPSVVDEIYGGRKEAITADRRLKKVSLDAGREQEGSFETTLYVEKEGIEPIEPVCSQETYTMEEAIKEATRCLDCKCLECVKGCAFLQHFKTFPRKYMREVYNNLSIAMGTRHANKMINACNICGQCKAICPNGLDVGAVIRDARQIMVESDKMPQSAFAFALEDMEQSNSEECVLIRHQKGFSTSSYVFFPGCQLGASVPDIVVKAYQDLTEKLDGGVGIMLGCCGITAEWAGQKKMFRDIQEQFCRRWEEMRRPKIITACPTCYSTVAGFVGIDKCTGIWDVLLDIWDKTQCSEAAGPVVVRDACGAREYPHIYANIRQLLNKAGFSVSQASFDREKSACCGFGGLAPYSSPQSAAESARLAVPDKDWNYVTYCMNCRDRYTKAGARAVHILELLYDEEQGQAHKVPGWSSRQDNRVRLKKMLQNQIWKETEEYEPGCPLKYSDEISALLEERMILESDIRRVILQAEDTGEKLLHRPSGSFVANGKIKHVTFWVWYRVLDEGYYIEKAYSHRMEIKES